MTAVAGITHAPLILPKRLSTALSAESLSTKSAKAALPPASIPRGLQFGSLHADGQVDPTLFIPKGTREYFTSVRKYNRSPQGTDFSRIEPRFQPELRRVYADVDGIYSGNLKASQLLKGLVSGEHSTAKTRYLAAFAIANGGPSKQTARLFRWYINEIEDITQKAKMPLYSDMLGLRVIAAVVPAWPIELRKPLIRELILRPDTLAGTEVKQRLLIPASKPRETTGKPGPFKLDGISVAKPAKFEPENSTPFENTFCYIEQRAILAKWLKQSMLQPPEPLAQCRNDVSASPGKTLMYNAPQLHEAITRFALRHDGQGRDLQHHKTLAWFADHLLTYDTQRILADKLGIPNSRFIDRSDGLDPGNLKTRWEEAWAVQIAIAFGKIKNTQLQARLLDDMMAHQETQSPTAGIARQVVQIVTRDKTPVEELILKLERLEQAG